MGNRALIKQANSDLCVYVHWNGGRESVEAFLKYCELRGFRPFTDSYGFARFVQVVSNFFGGSLSIGVDKYHEGDEDWMDNGVYVVDGWDIVGRIPENIIDEEVDQDDLLLSIKYIDSCQPEKDRLGNKFFDAKKVSIKDIKDGDIVYVLDSFEEWKRTKATMFKDGKIGYIDKYGFEMYYDNVNVKQLRKV